MTIRANDTIILSLPVETVAFAAFQHMDRTFSLDPRLHVRGRAAHVLGSNNKVIELFEA